MAEVEDKSITLREIKSFDELVSVSADWKELYNTSSLASPFQSPAWILSWWKYFGNNKLWSLTVYKGRSLMAIAPIYIFDYRNSKESLRQATFIGTGNTDYMDILCMKDNETEPAKVILDFIIDASDNWDICDFQELRHNSPMLEIKSTEKFEVVIKSSEACPVIKLPASFDEYLSCLPVQFRKNTVRAKRQLTDAGNLSLEMASESNLSEYISWLFRLHNESWKVRNVQGLFEESALQNFHMEAALELFLSGILRLYVLKHNERIIAALYSLIKNKRLYYYIGGFDPEFAKFSPGSVCLMEIIEEAISEGITEFDFLRGSESYKYKWNALDRANYRMFIKKLK